MQPQASISVPEPRVDGRSTRVPQDRAYARISQTSKRVRWSIDRDVLRGRTLRADQKFLPDALSLVGRADFLTANEQRLVSQIQGRTYAYIFGLVERFINAKVLELSRNYVLGDQIALEALVGFSEEEIKHQELFRRLEEQAARVMPDGYRATADANGVAHAVLSSSTWAVLALTCHIEMFTLVHYKDSIDEDPQLSELYRDVFRYHFLEESQHAQLDELEWRREDAGLSDQRRSEAVSDLIALVGAVNELITTQARADAEYFVSSVDRRLNAEQTAAMTDLFVQAYRYQYIASGIQKTKFAEVLAELVSPSDMDRIQQALAPLL